MFLKIPRCHKQTPAAAQRTVIKLVHLLCILFFLLFENHQKTGKSCYTDLNNENIWSSGDLKSFGHMEVVKYGANKKINEHSCLSARLSNYFQVL